MPQEISLPINEPNLLGLSAPVEVADPTGAIPVDTEPKTMQRRLWVLFPLVAMGTAIVSGGVNSKLLAILISGFPGATQASEAAALGIALSVSGIAYLVSAPLGGILSDKTRTRFLGRRNLWILGASLLGAVLLIALGSSTSVPMLITLATLLCIPLGIVAAAGIAVVPERVPLSKRGRISSLNGMVALIGSGVGIGLASVGSNPLIGSIVLAAPMVLFSALFALLTRDVPAPPRGAKKDKNAAVSVDTRFPTPKSHPDYWWTFVARGLAFMAYGLAVGLQLYALRDYFKVGDLASAEAALTAITLPSLAALALSALVGGILVDRFGRLKPFVFASSLLFVPGAIVLATVPTLTGAFIGFTIIGVAFGSYISVDGVLLTRVIPSNTNAARDLGLLNVSGAVGSIAAPALAGALVATTGYAPLFLLVVVAGALSSVCVLFIRSVR